jgi:threonine/homoserine efflux transporter RhtA
MSNHSQNRLQFFGWIIFVLSALFFIASSIRAEDPVSLVGGALFLAACFVFMIPLLVGNKSALKSEDT